jgi:c-di-GMP-related signal transduction protein
MQGQPMADLVATLPLSESLREALLGKENRERVLLSWLEKHERNEWANCDEIALTHALDHQELSKTYVNAVAWAEATMRMAS